MGEARAEGSDFVRTLEPRTARPGTRADRPAPATSALETPRYFDFADGQIYTVTHAALRPRRGTVLLCGPFGVERERAYMTLVQWARTLASRGFEVMRFDYRGHGESTGSFEDMTLELRRTNRRLEAAQGKLRRMVITDPLTGCRNRRFFEEIIGRELQRHRRYGIPMSLLFVDVDRFKAVNDTLGHDAGDRVLREVAAFLLSNIREADYVFRWGGDEFLILLSCGEEEARRRGTALQQDFARYSSAASLPAGVGLSMGCAEVREDSEDVMALIKVADERMYENKRAQRRSLPHSSGLGLYPRPPRNPWSKMNWEARWP